MLVDGYVRVSRVRGREGESFISPKQQREKIRRWAELRNHQIATIHEELDESGAKDNREKLLLALERVERGEVGGVVVARTDRFGRGLVQSLAAIERIERAGGLFASVDDGFDISTDTGRMVLQLMLSIGEWELRRIRRNFADARSRAVERGIHPSPVPPTGYVREQDADGHILGPLEPHAIFSSVISELFQRRARGESLSALARVLESRSVPTPYGAPHWTSSRVKDLMRNRVYLGEARHGEFAKPGAHPALVDEVTWRAAQKPGHLNKPRADAPSAVLPSLLRCAGCRYTMSHYPFRGGRQYTCQRRHAGGACPEPATASTSSGIEEYVVECFFSELGRLEQEPFEQLVVIDDLEAEVERARAALHVFRDDPRIIETLGAEHFAEGLASRKRMLEGALSRLEAAYADTTLPEGVPRSIELRDLWPDLTVEEKRRMLGSVIDCVFLRRGRSRHDPIDGFIHICFRGEAPDLMPRRGQKGAAYIPTAFRFPNEPPTSSGISRGQ